MNTFKNNTLSGILFRSPILISLIIWLAACPLRGQANFGLQAALEGDRLILSVDASMLEVPLLFVRHDTGQHQVQWIRQGDFIILEAPPVQSLTGIVIPSGEGPWEEPNTLGIFPIIKDGSSADTFRIDITELLLGATVKWKRQTLENKIRDKSYIESSRVLDRELIIVTRQTILKWEKERPLTIHYSFYLLPEPMRPRLFDHRMGFYGEDEYGTTHYIDETESAAVMRWRLEKENPSGVPARPVKPIVFYLDPAIPEKWKSYIRAGVMEWEPAFVAAGFRNALEIREVPQHNSPWPVESVTYSVIRWKMGQHIRGSDYQGGSTVKQVTDIRSGEILKADIIIGSSLDYLVDRYFARCAPLDQRVMENPVPDSLKGELLQSVVAHEAGHAFGIIDAHHGEYAYPFRKMRDTAWLREMGHTPSIMSYTRHNYIPQPEDRIPPSLLIQKVGPADHFLIEWAYTTFPGTPSPEVEKPYLEKLLSRQDSVPWYRHMKPDYEIIGPGYTNEVVDNDDPVQSTRLGLKNMQRVLEMLGKVRGEPMENYELERRYEEVMDLWINQMRHVMSVIGGYAVHNKRYAGTGAVYTPLPVEKQEEALAFFLQNAFDPPSWLQEPKIWSGLRHSSYPDILLDYQKRLLWELVRADRMKRLEAMRDAAPGQYTSEKLIFSLQAALFSDLAGADRRRQELRINYIEILAKAIAAVPDAFGDQYYLYTEHTKSILAQALASLKPRLEEALRTTKEPSALGHIRRCLARIEACAL